MRSLMPLWLLYLSSVLWLPPQLPSPARVYVTQRQIWIQLVQSLSHSTLYSAFTSTENPWATSKLNISPPLLSGLAGTTSTNIQSGPAQIFFLSRASCREGIVQTGSPCRVKWAHTWHNAIQYKSSARRKHSVWLVRISFLLRTEEGTFKRTMEHFKNNNVWKLNSWIIKHTVA